MGQKFVDQFIKFRNKLIMDFSPSLVIERPRPNFVNHFLSIEFYVAEFPQCYQVQPKLSFFSLKKHMKQIFEFSPKFAQLSVMDLMILPRSKWYDLGSTHPTIEIPKEALRKGNERIIYFLLLFYFSVIIICNNLQLRHISTINSVLNISQ